MTTTIPKIRDAKSKANWCAAMREAESRLAKIERERSKLLVAIRIIRRQIHDGAPWPGPDIQEDS